MSKVEVVFGRWNWVEVGSRSREGIRSSCRGHCLPSALCMQVRQLPTGLAAGDVGPEIGACSFEWMSPRRNATSTRGPNRLCHAKPGH